MTASGLCARSMGVKKYMSESSPSNPELHEVAPAYRTSVGNDLELPSAPGFVSSPPRMTPLEYVAWCEEMLPPFSARQADTNQRAKAHCHVEFVI